MNPTLIAIAVSAALAGSAGFGTAWTLQGRSIDKLKLEQRDDIITQQRATRALAERLTAAVTEAQAKAVSRNAAIRRDADSAASSGSGLRVTSGNAATIADDHADACRSIVRAYGVILDESSQFIREVAATADQCISDNQALTDAWTKLTSVETADVK